VKNAENKDNIDNTGRYGGGYNQVNHPTRTYFKYRSYYYPRYNTPYYESVYSNLKHTVYSPKRRHESDEN